MSQLGFLQQIYLSVTCDVRLVYFHRPFTFRVLTSDCTAFPYSLPPKLQNVSQERLELNIARPLRLKAKAQEHDCGAGWGGAERADCWKAALSHSSLPLRAVLLPLRLARGESR